MHFIFALADATPLPVPLVPVPQVAVDNEHVNSEEELLLYSDDLDSSEDDIVRSDGETSTGKSNSETEDNIKGEERKTNIS